MKDFDALPPNFANVLFKSEKLQIGQIASTEKFLSAHWADYTMTRVIEVENERQKLGLAVAVSQGIAEGEDHARCFTPNHALRAQCGELALEMVICFECDWSRAVLGDEDFDFATTRRAERLFDQYLPELAATREAWNRIRNLPDSRYLTAISPEFQKPRLESSLLLANELQDELRNQLNLEDRERMLRHLEGFKQNLLKSIAGLETQS